MDKLTTSQDGCITKLHRSKVVIEVDNSTEHVSFWETKYTYRQIVELVCSIPDLLAQVNSYNRTGEPEPGDHIR